MNPVLVDFGVIKIYWYSLLILIASLIGGFLFLKESKKYKMNQDKLLDMILYLIPIAMIGARLYFVIFNWSDYSSNFIDILKVWEGGLAIHGGIIAGGIWIVYYTRKHQLETLRVLDIAAPSLLIGQAIGRWGNFFNSEAHGPITTLETLKNLHIPNFIIEGMKIYGDYYHPTFLYESLWCLIGFIIILLIRKVLNMRLGQIFSLYLIWYGVGRFFIEGMRTDSLILDTFKVAQIVSLIMIVFGFVLFLYQQIKCRKLYKQKQ